MLFYFLHAADDIQSYGGNKMAHIAVKDLSFTYPNSTKKALDNINMEIEPGQFILVCGA